MLTFKINNSQFHIRHRHRGTLKLTQLTSVMVQLSQVLQGALSRQYTGASTVSEMS